MSRVSAVAVPAFVVAIFFGCSEKPASAPASKPVEETAVPAATEPAANVDDIDIFADQGPSSAREAGSSLFGTGTGLEEPDAVVLPGAESAPSPVDAAPANDSIEM